MKSPSQGNASSVVVVSSSIEEVVEVHVIVSELSSEIVPDVVLVDAVEELPPSSPDVESDSVPDVEPDAVFACDDDSSVVSSSCVDSVDGSADVALEGDVVSSTGIKISSVQPLRQSVAKPAKRPANPGETIRYNMTLGTFAQDVAKGQHIDRINHPNMGARALV